MMNWIAALIEMGASKPRKQQLFCTQETLSPNLFAIMRLTWYRKGKPYEVDEMSIEQAEEGTEAAVHMLVKEALKSGADVSIICACPPEALGIE